MESVSDNKVNLLSKDLEEILIEAIITGELAQGQKISEPELARSYGVSRGPLREAILKLQSLGLVERLPHVGARVIKLSKTQLIDIYAVREALEGMACRLAAQFMSDTQIDELQALLLRHQSHHDQHQGRSYFEQQGDIDFHYQIIKASHNQQLIRLLCDELYHLIRMYRHQSSKQHERPTRALKEHWAIWQALADRDAELAELLMRRHIARSRFIIDQQLELSSPEGKGK